MGESSPLCDVCGEHHVPNGTRRGDVAGIPIITDCRAPVPFGIALSGETYLPPPASEAVNVRP